MDFKTMLQKAYSGFYYNDPTKLITYFYLIKIEFKNYKIFLIILI